MSAKFQVVLEFNQTDMSDFIGFHSIDPKSSFYKRLKNESGIYAIFWKIQYNGIDKLMIVYVGQSKKIKNRLSGHPIINVMDSLMMKPEIRWMECNKIDMNHIEYSIIKNARPLFNIKGL